MSDSLLVLAFWMGIVSACSLPLGTLTTLVWRPDDRSGGILMAFGGGALLAAATLESVNGDSVSDYLETRQGLAPEAIAGSRESAASGLPAIFCKTLE